MQRIPRMAGQELCNLALSPQQPGNWIVPITDIRRFPGSRIELRLGQDIVLVGIGFDKVHIQKGAWICGSGLCQIGSQAAVRDEGNIKLMLGWVVKPAGALMIVSSIENQHCDVTFLVTLEEYSYLCLHPSLNSNVS
ncbi:hypothetical protein TURU_005696 [Turdus rufiventris]|nr:hypothetical protein TURU_005696 [Turdus rufiventris]